MIREGEKHWTVGAWLITQESPRRILLVHHKKFDRWLQPGGHQEWNENPLEATIREIEEETGIDMSSYVENQVEIFDEWSVRLPSPTFVMQYFIDPYKDQPQHFHLDWTYIWEVPRQAVKISEKESHDLQWFTHEQTKSLSVFNNTRRLLDEIFSRFSA